MEVVLVDSGAGGCRGRINEKFNILIMMTRLNNEKKNFE